MAVAPRQDLWPRLPAVIMASARRCLPPFKLPFSPAAATPVHTCMYALPLPPSLSPVELSQKRCPEEVGQVLQGSHGSSTRVEEQHGGILLSLPVGPCSR